MRWERDGSEIGGEMTGEVAGEVAGETAFGTAVTHGVRSECVCVGGEGGRGGGRVTLGVV